jgi:hypothetical protein
VGGLPAKLVFILPPELVPVDEAVDGDGTDTALVSVLIGPVVETFGLTFFLSIAPFPRRRAAAAVVAVSLLLLVTNIEAAARSTPLSRVIVLPPVPHDPDTKETQTEQLENRDQAGNKYRQRS